MLALMKRLTQSILGKFIAMIIIAGMAFWGVDQIFNQVRNGLGSDLLAAGKSSVTVEAFDRRIEVMLRNVNQQSDDPITKEQAMERGMVDQVFQLQQSQTTMLGFASKIGIEPSTDAVLAELRKQDAFKNPLTGELDLATYQRVLAQNRFSQAEYEAQLKSDLTLQALQTGTLAGLMPPDVLKAIQTRYLAESRDVAWFILDAADVPVPADPTEEEVLAFYNENLDALKQPERRAVDLLKVSADDFLSQVEVTDQEIATIYEASKSERFSEPEQRTYVELMFDTRDAARDAFAALAGGADPSTLQGIVSRESRTSLAADVEDQLLRDAMFGPGRQSGALFGPKDMGDGRWLVARLVSIQPGAVFPLESVSDEIRSGLARERATLLLYDKLEALDRSINAGFDLKQIAGEIGVPVISFEPVDKNGYTEDGLPMIGLLEAGDAFQQAFLMNVNDTSNQFTKDDVTYVISTREIVPPSTPEFDEVKDDVRQALVLRNEGEAAQTMVNEIKDRVTSGASTLEAEARAVSAPVETPPTSITRMTAEESGLPNSAIGGIFSGKPGDVFTYPNRTGDKYMIVQLQAVNDPSAEALAAADPNASSSLVSSLDSDLAAAMEAEMAGAVKLKVNGAAYNAYKASISSDQ
ncbi:peptidylprolyl isomerase [Hyphomonas jannaschiana]|uniref:Peptidylprolyl cis-trans isomerase-like protein n=1 Tax=Hyphomonas jannaschiana VP2 TaxID=1280952 RepID=A0A059FAW5_9PROT|nr:peptidylprolyl isomerase [Hyphomonas jannaschiana]KCZ87755.1 peptidylprolyl cis-trans isomerase-like protein [Hyphomonas jannaschiana VP2]